MYERRGWPMFRALRRGCEEVGELVARIAAEGEGTGDDLPLYYQDDEYRERECWAWRALFARGMGPTLEVYRLTR